MTDTESDSLVTAAGTAARVSVTAEPGLPTVLRSRYPDHAEATRLYGPDFLERDPLEVYQELRERHGPVAPVLLDSVPAWIVLGYRELAYVLDHPELYVRDSTGWNARDLIPSDWPLLPALESRDSVWWMEGERHRHRLAALEDGLDAVDPFFLQTSCEHIADELIDAFAPSGRADLVAQYAELLPLRVLARLLGIPHAESVDITTDMVIVANGGGDAYQAYQRQRAGLRRQVLARREDPGHDLLSRLVGHPARLNDDELLEELLTISGIAHQAASAWAGNALRLMLGDARFATTLIGGRRSVGDALVEVLWEDPPSPVLTGRWTSRATMLGAQRLAAGDLLLLSVATAHADLGIRRGGRVPDHGNQAHLAYGHGEHRCPLPAQEIGEAIAEVAVQVLLDRLPDVQLAIPAEDLRWRTSPWVRALTSLPVTFTPRH